MKRLIVAVALLAIGCGAPFSDPNRFDGDMTVGGETTLWGQGNGTWTVVSEGDLTLEGTVAGDLVVDTGDGPRSSGPWSAASSTTAAR